MLLKTERLTIRHIVADDWESIRDIWVDFNASEYAQYDMPHITDNADVKARMEKWAAANSGTEHMFFAVCLDSAVIGYIAFNIRENGYEIGYCFHSAYHGKGYARESHMALFDYLRTLGITKFSARTALNNNIDRFDVYRIYETLEYLNFSEMSLDDKRVKVASTIEKLTQFKEMKLGTATAKNLWLQRMDYYIGFYEKLKVQLDNSTTIL